MKPQRNVEKGEKEKGNNDRDENEYEVEEEGEDKDEEESPTEPSNSLKPLFIALSAVKQIKMLTLK